MRLKIDEMDETKARTPPYRFRYPVFLPLQIHERTSLRHGGAVDRDRDRDGLVGAGVGVAAVDLDVGVGFDECFDGEPHLSPHDLRG